MAGFWAGVALIAAIALLVLLILIGAILALPHRASGRRGVLGGGSAVRNLEDGGHAAHHLISRALYDYAKSLGDEHRMGVHPLDRERYEPLDASGGGDGESSESGQGGEGGQSGEGGQGSGQGGQGGEGGQGGQGGEGGQGSGPNAAATGGATRPAKPKAAERKWTDFETWEELRADKRAVAAYFRQRSEVINYPALDWSEVLHKIGPLLAKDYEYIGLVNLKPDGKTLYLAGFEASPVKAGSVDSDTTFAMVPEELILKYARRPALFIFHTHPADPRGSPFPSSQDLSVAIRLAAASRFVSNVVISRYGVFAYGLGWSGYRDILKAKDWQLAMLNLSHDVVAAYEAQRSWRPHSVRDILDFFPRHRLFVNVYPSPDFVGASFDELFVHDLESPINHETISDHAGEIAMRLLRHKGKKPLGYVSTLVPAQRRAAPRPPPLFAPDFLGAKRMGGPGLSFD